MGEIGLLESAQPGGDFGIEDENVHFSEFNAKERMSIFVEPTRTVWSSMLRLLACRKRG